MWSARFLDQRADKVYNVSVCLCERCQVPRVVNVLTKSRVSVGDPGSDGDLILCLWVRVIQSRGRSSRFLFILNVVHIRRLPRAGNLVIASL